MNEIATLKQHILVDGFHIVIDEHRSNGSWIVDKNTRKKYLDCYSQFASQALGWNHDKLRWNIDHSVVLHKLANSDMYSTTYANFVQKFSSITPDHEYYFFIEGGSLAIENALKVAFDWKQRKTPIANNQLDVIHLQQAFHGRTGYTMSLTNSGPLKTMYFPKFPWTRISNPAIYYGADDCKPVEEREKLSLEQAETALEKGNVAAIILEPIQGEGGDNHFRKEYFQGLRKLADQYGSMLIFDEVQTGLGLTGKMWCYQHFGVVPDILCFGKKVQVCGIAVTNRVDEVENHVFKVSGRINSTWGGNIVDMARSTKIIEVIEDEGLIDNAAIVGDYFKKRLFELSCVYQKMTAVRGRGLMIAFDMPSKEERDRLAGLLVYYGLLVLKCGKRSIRFRPVLTFSEWDVNTAIGVLHRALAEMERTPEEIVGECGEE